MINQILNKKSKEKRKISKINYKNRVITDSQDIADSFNDYFTNIAENLKSENKLVHGAESVGHSLPQSSRCEFDIELEDSSSSARNP